VIPPDESRELTSEEESQVKACLIRGANLLGFQNIWSEATERETLSGRERLIVNDLNLQTTNSSDLVVHKADKLASQIAEYEEEARKEKECLQQYKDVMSQYENFIEDLFEGDEVEEVDELEGSGDASTNTTAITFELLEKERAKTLELQEKFKRLCQLENECMAMCGASDEEVRNTLHDKIERVKGIQQTEKEEFCKLQSEIKSHLEIKAKLEAFDQLENDMHSMDKDVKAVAQLLMQEIEESFPNMEVSSTGRIDEGAATMKLPHSTNQMNLSDSSWKGRKDILTVKNISPESNNSCKVAFP